MNHPEEIRLALFAGGDLGFWDRWQLRRHLAHCPKCEAEAQALGSARRDLQGMASSMPADAQWQRLSEEMTANIHLGLEAGQCIERFEKRAPAYRPRRLAWHGALMMASAVAVMLVTMWLNLPKPQVDHLMSSLRRIRLNRIGELAGRTPAALEGVTLQASPAALEIRENGGKMSLLAPRPDGVTVTVSMQGSAGARYVDADSGQVTLNTVYYAQ